MRPTGASSTPFSHIRSFLLQNPLWISSNSSSRLSPPLLLSPSNPAGLLCPLTSTGTSHGAIKDKQSCSMCYVYITGLLHKPPPPSMLPIRFPPAPSQSRSGEDGVRHTRMHQFGAGRGFVAIFAAKYEFRQRSVATSAICLF